MAPFKSVTYGRPSWNVNKFPSFNLKDVPEIEAQFKENVVEYLRLTANCDMSRAQPKAARGAQPAGRAPNGCGLRAQRLLDTQGLHTEQR
jgi:hypothetical protein